MAAPNLACVRCRARKIKCDRGRPECDTCQRDGVDCEYSGPGKRVNHIKLLCESVEALDGRMADLDSKLSTLVKMLKWNGLDEHIKTVTDCIQEASPASSSEGSTFTQRSQLLQDAWSDAGVYHRPGSIFASCKSFATYVEKVAAENEELHDNVHLITLLNILCTDFESIAKNTAPRSLPAIEDIPLPPRQVLNMVVNQFFSQCKVDYMLDIFRPSTFRDKVATVYMKRSHADSWVWNVCLNMLVLISLDTDHQAGAADPFLQPYLAVFHTAAANLSKLMAPKLINIQVLILLAVVAQQYGSLQLSDTAFAQACLLARTLGLQNYGMTTQSISSEEVQEGRKTLRALYIHNMAGAIARGASSWLSGLEFAPTALPLLKSDPATSSTDILLKISEFQFEAYQLVNNSTASSKMVNSVLTLVTKLNAFASKHSIFESEKDKTLDKLDVKLSFLSTRIYLLSAMSSLSAQQEQQLVEDCRASFHLILPTDMTGLSPASNMSVPPPTFNPPLHANNTTTERTENEVALDRLLSAEAPQISLHRLMFCFPVSAAFHLARSVISTSTTKYPQTSSPPSNSISRLFSSISSAFFSALDPLADQTTHLSVMGRAVETLGQIVTLFSPSSDQFQPTILSSSSMDSDIFFKGSDINAPACLSDGQSWVPKSAARHKELQSLSSGGDDSFKNSVEFNNLLEAYWMDKRWESRERKRPRVSTEDMDTENDSTAMGEHYLASLQIDNIDDGSIFSSGFSRSDS